MRYAVYLLIALLSAPAAAQVYRSVKPDGTVEFSDQPEPGAKPVELAPLPTVSPTRAAPPPPRERSADPLEVYRRFEITAPLQDEGVRANDGNVTVSLALDPPLLPGHRILLRLDGQEVGEPAASLSVPLLNLDRGTHRLDASVVDATGRSVVSAAPITFHVLRVHLGAVAPAPRPVR
jgi:hypothetical protein